MKTHHLNAGLELPLPVEQVFPFFADAENLQRITPPEMGFRIVSGTPVKIEEGTVIDYRVSVFGISFPWRSLIEEWQPGVSFVDVQLKGPYRLWRHMHRFDRSPNGTHIRDTVTYALPLSPLSEIAFPLIRRQLQRIFTFRQLQVIREFGLEKDDCSWSVVA